MIEPEGAAAPLLIAPEAIARVADGEVHVLNGQGGIAVHVDAGPVKDAAAREGEAIARVCLQRPDGHAAVAFDQAPDALGRAGGAQRAVFRGDDDGEAVDVVLDHRGVGSALPVAVNVEGLGVGVEGKDPVVQNILLVALRHRDAGHAQGVGPLAQDHIGGPGAAVRLTDDALVVDHGAEGLDKAAVIKGDALGEAEDGRLGGGEDAGAALQIQSALPARAAVHGIEDVVVGVELQVPQGQRRPAHIDAGGSCVIGADKGQTVVAVSGDGGVR